jgi:hypothetical protein
VKLYIDDKPIGEIFRLRLLPDERLTLHLNRSLSPEELEQIDTYFAKWLPPGQRILVLESDAHLTVVTTADDLSGEQLLPFSPIEQP